MPSDEIRAEHCAISEVEFEQDEKCPHPVHAGIFCTSFVHNRLFEIWDSVSLLRPWLILLLWENQGCREADRKLI
jgi:hypothetical protein